MGKPIIEVTRAVITGGVNVNLRGNAVEVMSALSAIAISIMKDCCESGKVEEKEVAEALIYAVKLGIEEYLKGAHGGEGGAE